MLKVGIEASGMIARKGATGLHRYLNNLVTHVAAQAEANDLHLTLYFADRPQGDLHASDSPLAAVLPGPSIAWRVAPTPRGWWRVGMGMAMQLDRLDLFHFPSPHVSTYCPKPTVVTVHDLAALSLEPDLAVKERRYLRDATKAIRQATALIAVSRSAADEIARHLGRSDALVIPEGVDRARFKPVPDARQIVSQRFGLADYVLCTGTIQTRKNHVRLVQAFEHIQAHVPHTLVIAGRDGSGTDALLAYLEAHPDARVRRLGYVDEHLLPALYTAADALALPSLWEGFGLPLVEAMACGTPVLASNTPSLIETAGQAALVVDPLDTGDIASKLHALLTDEPMRRDMIQAGFRRVEALSWEKAARQTIEVYQRVQSL